MLTFDPLVEIEFQKTNVALGKPVDVDRLLDVVESIREDVSGELDIAQSKITELEHEVTDLENDNDALKEDLKASEDEVSSLETRIAELENEIEELKSD